MSALINQKELEKILKVMLEKMQKQGVVLSIKDKDSLIKTVAEKILNVRKDLSNDNIKDMQFQKLLRVALLSQHLENTSPDKKLNFDFAKLFDKKLLLKLDPKKMKELNKQLELTFKFLLTKLNTLDPKNKLSEKQIGELAKDLTNKFLNKLEPKGSSLRDTANILDTQLDQAMRSLFGGIKPGLAGCVPIIVYQIAGNTCGIADQHGGNEQSFSFIDALNRYDGKADYAGIENANFQRLVSIDSTEVDSILTSREATSASAPTPFHTTPAPDKK